MQTIAIVDYGMGNVRSVLKALEFVAPNDQCVLTNDSQIINDSDRVVFPGQGAMRACMVALQENDLIEVIKVASKEKPFLGICLGAQMLAKNLGAKVTPAYDKSCEIGFFDIHPNDKGAKIFKNQKTFFQWHSEGFDLPGGSKLLARGNKFPNQAFCYNNAYGIQFHPEVNFKMHLMWLYFASYRLKEVGAQSRKHQLTQRLKYGKKINMWLDNFLDNYLLKT